MLSSVLRIERWQKPTLPAVVLFMQCFVLALLVLAPLCMLISRALFDDAGHYLGLQNFKIYFGNPAFITSVLNSFGMAAIASGITLLLAAIYAYALCNSHIPFKRFFRVVALVPILAPSLLPAIALVYLFGKQGWLKSWMGDYEIYGPIGICIAFCFWLFPHVLMILLTAFRGLDARLVDASHSLGAGRVRTFIRVTMPAIRYGLISAVMISMTYVLTDFGIPKVIGGGFNMLAVDVYKQIIGQQNFAMGAVVSVVLLLPAFLSFAIDRWQSGAASRYQQQEVHTYLAPKNAGRDFLLFIFCSLVALALLTIVGTAFFASLAKVWPYNLSLSFEHYRFEFVDGGGWNSYFNSLRMAAMVAIGGTVFVFVAAFSSQRLQGLGLLKNSLQAMALLPMAIPGMVLGIAYIFFFNHPGNPLQFLYGSIGILVLATVVHYYTVPHLTALTALKQLPAQIDAAAASLGVPVWKTFWRVYLPICLPVVLDISVYFFVNAMTTVSAAIFLYSSDTTLASVAVLNMDDAGDTAPAAAMAVLIFLSSLLMKLLHWAVTRGFLDSSQRWRQPET